MKTCPQTRLYCFEGKILKNKKEYSNTYLKEAILKNKYLAAIYIVTGMAGSFLINVKADCFQRVIDGLADRTLTGDVLFWYGKTDAAD